MTERAQACFDRYRENLALAGRMDAELPESNGWVAVVRFYAVVHLMNAYLVDKTNLQFDPASTEHLERKKAMERCPELREAPRRYRQLKDISEAVRYDAGFKYTPANDKDVLAHVRKIVSIVEPKIIGPAA